MSPGYIGGGAGYTLSHVDEMIDELLTTDYSCDIALPRVPKRWVTGFLIFIASNSSERNWGEPIRFL
jgi:hypothetical protein